MKKKSSKLRIWGNERRTALLSCLGRGSKGDGRDMTLDVAGCWLGKKCKWECKKCKRWI